MVTNTWIPLILLTSVPIYVSMQTVPLDDGMFSLYDNGTVRDSSESPFCENKRKISLSSYSFKRKKTCNFNNTKCKFQAIPLSPEAELLLHGGCSFKEECNGLDFAKEAKEQYYNNSLHSLLIDYHCLDEADRLYELCDDRVATLTGTMHLMTGKGTQQFTRCQCSLKAENDSLIRVTMKDIRLHSTDKQRRICSQSVLKVDDNTYACNATSSTYGSVFNEFLATKAYAEVLSISLDVQGGDIDMVWLTVEAQGPITVECTGRLKEAVNLMTTSNNEYIHSIKDSRYMGYTTEDPGSRMIIYVTIVIIVIVCVTIILCIIQRRRTKAANTEITVAAPVESSDIKQVERPDTTYIKIDNADLGNQLQECKGTDEETESSPNTSIWRQLAELIQRLFQHKSIKSKGVSKSDSAGVEETFCIDSDDLKSDRVDNHPAGSSSDTEESLSSEETIKYDCMNVITRIPVHESGHSESGDLVVEKSHTYALLNQSLSKDGGLGINANEVYNTAPLKRPTPQTDPTYSRLLIGRSASYNYARNKYLMSQI